MDRNERINNALTRLQAREAERKTRISELEALVNKWKELAEMTRWAELSSGANVAEGDKVRHLFKTYICIKAHTKALTRSPINTEYWTEASD